MKLPLNLALSSLLLSTLVLTGCDGVSIVGVDSTDGEMTQTAYMDGGDLYLNECSVVYTTNMFRSVIDYSDRSYSDGEGDIVGGRSRVILRDYYGSKLSDSSTALPRLNYGDILETSIEFPTYTRIFDMIGANFDLFYNDLEIRYTNNQYNKTTSADDGLNRDCFYMYFITLHNANYTGSKDVLAARTASGISTVAARTASGEKAVAATLAFDMLADFAESNGIVATDRREIVKQMKQKNLLGKFLEYRKTIKTTTETAKEALAARSAAVGTSTLALERMKSQLGIGAPKKLIATIDKMIQYARNVK